MMGPILYCVLLIFHFSSRNTECLPAGEMQFLEYHILKDIIFHLSMPEVYPNKGNGLLPRKA